MLFCIRQKASGGTGEAGRLTAADGRQKGAQAIPVQRRGQGKVVGAHGQPEHLQKGIQGRGRYAVQPPQQHQRRQPVGQVLRDEAVVGGCRPLGDHIGGVGVEGVVQGGLRGGPGIVQKLQRGAHGTPQARATVTRSVSSCSTKRAVRGLSPSANRR